MTPVERLIEAVRQEFTKELESTGAYTKAGMQLAFERAVSRALAKLTEMR